MSEVWIMRWKSWCFLLLLFLPFMKNPSPSYADVLNRALGVTTGDVKVMQLCLQAIGHDPGPIDGLWGPKTQIAFTQWLLNSGLPEQARGDAVVKHFTRRCRTAMLQDSRKPARGFQDTDRHASATQQPVMREFQQRIQELERQAERQDDVSAPIKPLVSKEDAQKMFGMSKQLWNQNVLGAAQLGVAQKHRGQNGTLGIMIQSSRGWRMRVTPAYDDTDRAPTRIHLAVVYPSTIEAALSDDVLRQALHEVNRELAPEYAMRMAHQRRGNGLEIHLFIEKTTGFYPQY